MSANELWSLNHDVALFPLSLFPENFSIFKVTMVSDFVLLSVRNISSTKLNV